VSGKTGSIPIDGVKQLVVQPTHRIETGASVSFSRQQQRPLGGLMYKHAYRVLISKGGEVRILPLNQHDSLSGRLDLVFASGEPLVPDGEVKENLRPEAGTALESPEPSVRQRE
jgi:hypothetical protein